MKRNTHRYSPRQEVSLLSWFFFGTALVLSWVTGVAQAAPWLPFFLSIFVFGLSHGAADWLLLKPTSRKSGVTAFALYSLIGLVIGLLAWLSPLVIIVGFFLLTVVHFGINDERDLRSFSSTEDSPRVSRFGGVLRMGLFLSLVCYTDPGGVASLFGRVALLLGAETDSLFAVGLFGRLSGISALVFSLAWIMSLVLHGTHLFRSSRLEAGKRILVDLGETSALVACAMTLPSIYAVGLYFLCWHAFRHTLLVSRREMPESGGNLAREVFKLHLRSWPLSLPVIPLMLWLVWKNGILTSPLDWVAAFLVVCIIFTLPHHWIIERTLKSPGSTGALQDFSNPQQVSLERRRALFVVEREKITNTPIFL